MILSDTDLARRVGSSVGFDPAVDDSQIQPASVDLRMGDHLWNKTRDVTLSEREGKSHRLFPYHETGDFYLGSTLEYVSVPDDLLGIMAGRSTFGREGVVVHATAGWVDPGFEGELTLEMVNFGPDPVDITVGERVAQIGFLETKTPSSGYSGTYQGQRGPTDAKDRHLDP